MNPTGKGGVQFQSGNKLGQGGARPGAGRQLQPSRKALRVMKRYLDLLYISDAKLMAHLALRPEEFDDQVQFAGAEEDGLQPDGKPYQKRTGGYALDPLFKARLDMLKFRWAKMIPDPPKEVEVTGDVQMRGLPPQMLQVLLQSVNQLTSPSNSKPPSFEIPSTLPAPSASHVLTNGKHESSMTAELQAALLSGAQTESAKPSSSV